MFMLLDYICIEILTDLDNWDGLFFILHLQASCLLIIKLTFSILIGR